MQWHDELFPREKVYELFDAIGSSDKRLHAHPGKHGDVPPEEFEASERFLALHLGTELRAAGSGAGGRGHSTSDAAARAASATRVSVGP